MALKLATNHQLKIQAPEDIAPCYRGCPHKTKYLRNTPIVHTHHKALRPVQYFVELTHSCIDLVVDRQHYRRGRSTVDQLTLLTQYIEDSFQHNYKAGVVFLDLTADYDTVWRSGLHPKLLRTITDRHMVGFIMEMFFLSIPPLSLSLSLSLSHVVSLVDKCVPEERRVKHWFD